MSGPLAVERRRALAARRWALPAALAALASVAVGACALDPEGFLANAGSTPASAGASGGGAGAGGETTTESSSGAAGGGGAGGQGGSEPVSPYLYRQPISITTGKSAAPPDNSIAIKLDHSWLVLKNKSLASGDDVRIYRKAGDAYEELHRVLDPSSAWNTASTLLWFRLQTGIPAMSTDTSYYVFYGDPDAPKPPADGTKVYLAWDDFSSPSLSPAWTIEPIGNAMGTVTQMNGVVTITAKTGDIWDQQDSFVFLYRPVSGNFVADSVVTAVGGASDQWGKLGGVMIRESTLASSRNRLMSPIRSAAARTNSYRLKDGNDTSEERVSGLFEPPEFDRVTRMGDRSSAYFSTDGKAYQKLGNEITFVTPLSETVLVGIPVCNLLAEDVTVSVDWFRVRRLIDPEPTTTLLPEEAGNF